MKKRFSFRSAHEQRVPASSAAALHHRVWPGISLLQADVSSGHTFICGTTGAGKSFLLQDVMNTVLRAPYAGGQHAQ
ncbi:hypothetical protein N3553_24600 [Pantoea dispersa]|uniref:hypothetical protein n=1 Tax=Pantoea dispersa TaxID=59814 RepID=UPI000FD81CF9|nr:hypothetical protein [Pantoea dispersa]MCT6593044.1 hypothetical protein [Pantoea dispersa]MCW0323819.1 hypothetical protein [Pantoea dispersa]MCW0328556.1 hypothetical protein [Pantoea dispersa]MCW0434981.1 hypothetical protein [Pantoea dispersa]RVU71984.1 hypothetical protein EKH82_24300 [Pantoea dispersa]